MMKRLCLALALSALWLSAPAQTAPASVSVSAKGDDVRVVLHDLFSQLGKNYVLEPGVRFILFLNLKEVEFEEALQLICKTANLKFELQNGIYFVNGAPSRPASNPNPAPANPTSTPTAKPESKPETKPVAKPETKTAPQSGPTIIRPQTQPTTLPKPEVKAETKPEVKPQAKPTTPAPTGPKPITAPTASKGRLDKGVLTRRVNTRASKIDIRSLFADLGKQTGIVIEVATNVPAYRLDAYLNNTSLKFALDNIAKAASLEYSFTDRNSILLRQRGSAKTGR